MTKLLARSEVKMREDGEDERLKEGETIKYL